MWQVRQLEAFALVVSEGSITRAAEKLNISQPAASKLVSTLEHNCGFPLFKRQGNRLTITVEGELLYGEVQRLASSTEQIRAKALEIRDHQFGTLHIAAFPALASRLLPVIVHDFMKAHPRVKPLLSSRSSQFLVDWVAVQKSDIGIGMVAQEQPGIRFHRMMQLNGVCALPVGHHLAQQEVICPRDIDGENFIGLTTDSRTRFEIDRFFSGRCARANIVAEVQMSEAACQMVANGAGVAIVEPFSALGFTSDEIIVRPISPSVLFNVWLMYPTHRSLSRIAREFAYHLEQGMTSVLKKNHMEFIPFPLDLDEGHG